ncbi:hypothetical protein ABEV54_05440 [Peribacillus psychrosaccharolyticus]|uniref:hypothetical protein n=1 Tax=Peribacillus psychrosaccharolyticus TaxID=1407 RepID=UPI003D26C44C
MKNNKTFLTVDEYLDLYLFAKNLGDIQWQNEIIAQLKNHNQKTDKTWEIQALWESFERVNNKILALYKELRNDSTISEAIGEKLWTLKQQRIEISREIRCLQEGNTFITN